MSMFSHAVSSLSRLGSWNTTPKRRRTSVGSVVGSSPSSSSEPLVGWSRVVGILIVVVFPAPFGPRNAKISPPRTSKETSPTAVTFPNDFTTCWTRMIGRSLTTCVLRPRRRRFGRVDELVVVAHRQAGGRRVVDDDGRITVQLDGTRRHHAGDRPLDGLGDRLGLGFPARHQDQPPRIEDGPDAHRDRVDRHILSALEEPGVVVNGLLGQRLQPRARAQGAPRLVEGDVAVRADAQDLQVDPAAFRNPPLVPLAEGGVVAGRARGDIDVVRSEEHTSELQSHHDLVCRLLLEKKKKKKIIYKIIFILRIT